MIIKRQFGKDVPPGAQDDRSDEYERWFEKACREIEQPQPKATRGEIIEKDGIDYPAIYRDTEAAVKTLGRAYTAFGERMATAIVEAAEQGRRDRNRVALGIFSPSSGSVFYRRSEDEAEAKATRVKVKVEIVAPPAPRNRFALIELDD